MRQAIFKVIFITYFILATTVHMVQAQTTKYVVLPFKVNAPSGYIYLEKAVPSMLTSRLHKDKYFQPVSESEVAKIGKVSKSDDIEKIQKKMGIDVVIWGEVSIIGDDAVLDIRIYRDSGIAWRQHKNTKVNDLIAALQELTDGINQNIVNHGSSVGQAELEVSNTPVIRHSDTSSQKEQVYCNPQFHYQGGDDLQKRSQALPFASIGIVVADVTGDKKNEVVLLGEHQVYVYCWENGRLILLGEHKLSRSIKPIALRSFDFNGDGVHNIIVSGYESTYGKPYSLVLSYKNKVFKEVSSNIPFYMNVVKLPPDFSPVIIGQKEGSSQIFSRNGVCRVDVNGNSFTLGSQLLLPTEINVFSFSWIPGTATKSDNKLVAVNSREQLVVYSSTGSKLAITGEIYYGASVGIDEPMNMPGLGTPKDLIPTKYFIPIRMVPIYLEGKKQWGLLASRSISIAAQFFENYRSFTEGEIQALFWDGMGLALDYKTPLIKGTITDFVVGDINNDGQLELVTSVNSYVNSYAGALGLGKRRTIVVFSPMEKAVSKN